MIEFFMVFIVLTALFGPFVLGKELLIYLDKQEQSNVG